MPTPLLEGPWVDVATDLIGPLPSGHSLLVVVDYFSRYAELNVLHSTTTEKVTDGLEEAFGRHGIPNALKTDNGPQFVSTQFQSFMSKNEMPELHQGGRMRTEKLSARTRH